LINGLFGLLIIANSGIGIIQELRAKKTLDNLAIVGQAKPTVRRQSGTTQVAPNEVVLDDVIELGPGDQIVVDGEMLEASNLEVDESLLTGEADPIGKAAGDAVMSGSFVVAGAGAYRATKVGREAYAAGWPRRPAGSPWSSPNCAAASTRSCSSSPTCSGPPGC
jgi:cation-transporting ATPase E